MIARAWLWLKTWGPWLLAVALGVLLCWTRWGRALLILPDRTRSNAARDRAARLKERNDRRRAELRRAKEARKDARYRTEAMVDRGDLAGALDNLAGGGRGALPVEAPEDGNDRPDT